MGQSEAVNQRKEKRQWPKRPILHYAENKRLGNTNPTKRSFRRISSFCSISDTRRVTLVRNPMISHERKKKDGIVTTTKGSILAVICDTDIP